MSTAKTARYPVTIDGETAHIGTADELAIALDVLHGRHDRAVLEQLRQHLADVIATPVGFETVLKSLDSADQTFLIDALGVGLVGVLRDVRYLRDLLATLSDVGIEEHLLNTLGTAGLRALIVTAEHLSEVLEWVYGECDVLLLHLLGADYVRGLVQNSYELALLLNGMERAMQSALIEHLGWERVVGLVSDGRDLAYLMRALPASLGTQLLERFSRDRLLELIHNASDWKYLWERLDSTEAEVLRQILAPVPNGSLGGKGTAADAA